VASDAGYRQQIFIDMNGSYLGEIIYENRLMFNLSSGYRSINFGSYGNYGNVATMGTLETMGA
jgi:hypothetical protein